MMYCVPGRPSRLFSPNERSISQMTRPTDSSPEESA